MFHTAIVATVLVFRSKNQDDLDKKTNNHLPLPLDYASNEGKIDILFYIFAYCVGPTYKFISKQIFEPNVIQN